ncbi:hypothetical protein C8Q80DRAFT_392890 [Daedaleopsis nitida]|nr:hypothetical protein C8Q80DRAFT_392890 [Daedaleopsis nitida]
MPTAHRVDIDACVRACVLVCSHRTHIHTPHWCNAGQLSMSVDGVHQGYIRGNGQILWVALGARAAGPYCESPPEAGSMREGNEEAVRAGSLTASCEDDGVEFRAFACVPGNLEEVSRGRLGHCDRGHGQRHGSVHLHLQGSGQYWHGHAAAPAGTSTSTGPPEFALSRRTGLNARVSGVRSAVCRRISPFTDLAVRMPDRARTHASEQRFAQESEHVVRAHTIRAV